MNGYSCDTVRDLLPQMARGGLGIRDATRVRTHLDACVDCSDEADLVALIQTTLDPLPDGLEARVLAAVQKSGTRRPIIGPAATAAGAAPAGRRVPARRWSARLALAATIAAVAVGGVVVLERAGLRVAGTGPAVDTDAPAMSILSWAGADDAMLHGSTVLEELTVEELEQLLEELDS